MKRSPIGRKTGLERRRLLKRRRPWRAGAAGDDALRSAFYSFAGGCAREHEFAGARCDGILDPHHVIPKQALKSYAKTHRLDARSLALLLWDTQNRLVLCRRHHQLHEGAHDRVPRYLLPAAATAFAQTLALDYLLDRLYPAQEETDEC